MSHQYAALDPNRNAALLGHSGTAGTAETRRVTVTESGAKQGLDSYILGGTVSTDVVETTGFNGGTVSVGTAAVELTFTGVTQGIMITADHSNTGAIYIGGSAVTSAGADALTRLAAGESLSVDINDTAAAFYAVSDAAAQKVYKVALT